MLRRLANHPDKGGDAEAFQRISEAYSVLSDPQKRREYDSADVVGDDQMRSVPVVDPFELFQAFFDSQDLSAQDVFADFFGKVAVMRNGHFVTQSLHRTGAFAFDSNSDEREFFDSDVALREAIERSKYDTGHAVDDEDLLLKEALERSKFTVGVSEDDDDIALKEALRRSEREFGRSTADHDDLLLNQALERSQLEPSSSPVEDDDDIRTAIAMSLDNQEPCDDPLVARRRQQLDALHRRGVDTS